MIGITSKGDYTKTLKFLSRLTQLDIDLNKHGQLGVDALSRATPVDTGLTASSWKYRVIKVRNGSAIEWYNTNTRTGASVAILIQYGHGTGTGGYVQGVDYINPAIRPVFDQIATEVTRRLKA